MTRFNRIPIKISIESFAKMEKPNLKFIRNHKGHRITKVILKREKQNTASEDSHFPIPKLPTRPGLVPHACNPSTLGGRGGWSPEASLRPAWPTWWNSVSTENKKISRAWWWAPVIPATQEAEAGETLEPRSQRLQWAGIMPLHSCLGDRGRPCLKK